METRSKENELQNVRTAFVMIFIITLTLFAFLALIKVSDSVAKLTVTLERTNSLLGCVAPDEKLEVRVLALEEDKKRVDKNTTLLLNAHQQLAKKLAEPEKKQEKKKSWFGK